MSDQHEPIPAPTPGHPAGCCCGECDARRQHADTDPRHQRCNEHGRCLACDGCDPCQLEIERGNEIHEQVRELPALVREAQRAVDKVQAGFSELSRLWDIELTEGPDGPDAVWELGEVRRHLRHVQRIADARWKVERDYEVAAAVADDDVPEFDDDLVVAFTRDQVNEWAGRRLTDGELARLGEAAPDSAIPVAIFALASGLAQDSQEDQIPVGEPFPGRPGYVTGECGHAVAGSEWRAGYRRCEHCPPGPQDEPEEEPETPELDLGPEIDDQGGMSEVLPSYFDRREG